MITRLPDNLPTLLRDAGLTVVEVDGWRTRSRPGDFRPVGVLNHHTGANGIGMLVAQIKSYLYFIFNVGRPADGIPGPLCQIVLWPDGTVYIGAAGRANHAGVAKARGTVAAGDGNTLYVGVEWMLSGLQKIPKVMYDAGLVLNAVLLEDVLGTSTSTVAAHYETSVTGKWDIGDPDGVEFKGHKVLNMVAFRAGVERVVLAMRRPVKPPTTVAKARDLLEKALDRAKPGSVRRRKIRAALKSLPSR